MNATHRRSESDISTACGGESRAVYGLWSHFHTEVFGMREGPFETAIV